jgi:integrase
MNRPDNKTIITKYLNHYEHSPQSVRMRKSSLRSFFGMYFPFENGEENKTWFNYEGHVFDIDEEIILDYFDYLKTLDTLSITTRKNKWRVFTSFLSYTMYRYRKKFNFIFIKPPKDYMSFKNATPKKTEVKSNRKVFATTEEIKKILDYLSTHNFKHYLIFRMFIETGMRKGELIHLKWHNVNPDERYVNPRGKTDEKYYFYSEAFAKLLNIYLDERKSINVDIDNFFITKDFHKYSNRAFNLILKGKFRKKKNGERVKDKGILDNVGIAKNITCHTFRRTLNDLRKEMGCSNEDRRLLLGHAVNDVNVESYTNSDYKKLRELHDQWNPYKDLKL